jgi:uncharacterized protein YndB with AHSA1/START domain
MKMSIDKITQTMDFPCTAERVWRAVTEPEELSKWFGDQIILEPVVGSDIVFIWKEHGRSTGRVETFDPPRQFAFRWRAQGIDENAPLAPDNSTLVTFTIIPTREGARLEVVETGFADLPPALRATVYRENNHGWQVELQELATYIYESIGE